MPLFGPPDVEKLWLRGDTEGLFKALRYKDARIRQAAARALVKMGYAQVVAEELERTTSPADDEWIVEILIAILKEWDIIARRTAIVMLVKTGAPAVEPLTAALGSENARMRQSAATALGQLAPQLVEAALHVRIVESLIAVLKDEEGGTRRAAARALGQVAVQLKDPVLRVRITKALITTLKDSYDNEAVCQAAAEALDELDWQPGRNQAGAVYWIAKGQLDKCVEIGPAAVPPLIAALEYMDRDVRRAAAETLDRLGWRPDQRATGAFYQAARGNRS